MYIDAGDPEPGLTENWVPFIYRDGKEIDVDPVPFAIVWEGGPSEWAYRAKEGGRDVELTLELRAATGFMNAVVNTPEAVDWPVGVQAEPYFSYALGLYEE